MGVGHADAVAMTGQWHKIRLAEHASRLLIDGLDDIGNSGALKRVEVVVATNIGNRLKGDAAHHLLCDAELDNFTDLIFVHATCNSRRQIDRYLVPGQVGNGLLFYCPQIQAAQFLVSALTKTIKLEIDLEIAL